MKLFGKLALGLVCLLVGSASFATTYTEYVCGVYDGTYIYNVAGTYKEATVVNYTETFCKTWSETPAHCDPTRRIVCKKVSPSPTKPVSFKFIGALDVRTGKQVKQLRRPVHIPAGRSEQGVSTPATNSSASVTAATNGHPGKGGGECTVFEGCSFPNSCQNGWCVAPGGGGGECTPFAGCEFPNRCDNGWCVAPGGGGGECTPFSGCDFPNRCENGWCVAP